MTFQPGAMLYTQGFGSRPENVEVPHLDTRSPGPQDILYPIGKKWIYINNSVWELIGLTTSNGVTTPNWVQAVSSVGDVLSVTGTAPITATPTTGNVVVGMSGPFNLTTVSGVLTGNGTSAVTGSAVTQNGVVIGGAANAVSTTAVGATGTVLSGNTAGAPTFNSLATSNVVTNATATIALANNTTYIASDASAVTATLPAIAGSVVGSWIRVISTGAGGVTIAQTAGVQVHQGAAHSTSGATGTTTLIEYDAVELLCVSVVPATSVTWVATSANDTLTYA